VFVDRKSTRGNGGDSVSSLVESDREFPGCMEKKGDEMVNIPMFLHLSSVQSNGLFQSTRHGAQCKESFPRALVRRNSLQIIVNEEDGHKSLMEVMRWYRQNGNAEPLEESWSELGINMAHEGC
jgi:hypothetical protein